MNLSLIITVILAILYGSSLFVVFSIPSGIDEQDFLASGLSSKEIAIEVERARVTFRRRRYFYSLVALLGLGALISSMTEGNMLLTGGFAGAVVSIVTLYATVLYERFDM